MKHITIDQNKCIGCKICKTVCIRDNIEIIDNQAQETENDCFDCGQCSTACPTNAITLNVYKNQPIEIYNPDKIPVTPENLLQLYKQRRSCRWFKKEKLTKEEIKELLQAAYYSPNRQNIQDVEYVLIEETQPFIEHIYQIIKENEDEYPRIKQLGEYLEDENHDPDRHPLLWEGKQILLAFSQSQTDAVIAMTRLELLAYTKGYAGFYSLFIQMADQTNHTKLMQYFPEIDQNKHMYAVFIIGKPRIKYKRTRPHKEIKLTIK